MIFADDGFLRLLRDVFANFAVRFDEKLLTAKYAKGAQSSQSSQRKNLHLACQKKSMPNTTLRPGKITPGISSYCVSLKLESTKCAAT